MIIPDTITGLPVTSIGGGFTSGAFWNCTNVTSVTIPDSVTSIGEFAFAQSGLTSVAIPHGVIDLLGWAFASCGSLTSVTIGTNVTSIGFGTFMNSAGLANVTIGNSVTNVGDAAFRDCTNLTGVYFMGNAPGQGGSSVFTGATNATVYYLPGTAGWGPTFGGRPTMLWNVQGPFAYTTDEGTVTITGYTGPGGALTIPDTINGLPVTSIEVYAFGFCHGLTSVTIPPSVISIRDRAFGDCTSLTAITVNPLNPVYGSLDGVLVNRSQTALIEYPEGKAGAYAISNTVTSIGAWAFWDCTNLTNVTTPNSVTNIGDGAFRGCSSLTGAFFWGNAPTLGGASVFAADNNATVYYLPSTSGWGTTFGGRPAVPMEPPAIQTAPQTQTAKVGSTVEFQVEASGTPPLDYQWFFNATNVVPGGTNSILQLTDLQLSQSGSYSVVVSNAYGSATSPPALLTVTALPVIVAPP